MTDELRVEREGPIASLVLDRPEKRNAVTRTMWERIPTVLGELAGDPEARVLVVRGAGDHFCAGADISEFGERLGGEDGGRYAQLNREAEEAIAAFPKPTVAVVRGACVGGGCQIAVACDLRLADTTARFGVTPARLGIVYPAEAIERLTRLIGPSGAKWLLYTAELVGADHALRIGLVDALHDPAELDTAANDLCRVLASRSLLTQRASKEMVDAVTTSGHVPDELARFWTREVAEGGDVAEGVAAFLERREPDFPWTHPTQDR